MGVKAGAASYAAGLAAAATIAYAAGLSWPQVVSVSAFVGVVLGAILFWRMRVAFAMLGVTAMLATNVLTPKTLIEHAHLDVVLFLIGAMITIGYLEEMGFFEQILEGLLRRFNRSSTLLISMFLAMAALLAAAVDELSLIHI